MGARAYLLSAPWPPIRTPAIPTRDPGADLGLDAATLACLASRRGVVVRCDGLSPDQARWLDARAGAIGATAVRAAGGGEGRAIACGTSVIEDLARQAAAAHPEVARALDHVLAHLAGRPVAWRLPGGTRLLAGGGRILLMGILNVTPDSFSDGGRYLDPGAAKDHGLRLARDGADIIDVGGESSRPGADPVPEEEECRRTIPVIEALRAALPEGVAISIDTMKAGVARAAVRAGAGIINDVSALGADPAMAGAAAETGAAVVLNHMRGTPRTMQADPRYDRVIPDVLGDLADRVEAAVRAGVAAEAIAVDPGIGFGKTPAHNAALLRHLSAFACLGRPLAVGLSRKSFLGRLAPDAGAAGDARADSTLASETLAVIAGSHILRTHDPARARRAALVAGAVLSYHSDQDRC